MKNNKVATAVVLALSIMVSILFLVYALYQKSEAEKWKFEARKLEQEQLLLKEQIVATQRIAEQERYQAQKALLEAQSLMKKK